MLQKKHIVTNKCNIFKYVNNNLGLEDALSNIFEDVLSNILEDTLSNILNVSKDVDNIL